MHVGGIGKGVGRKRKTERIGKWGVGEGAEWGEGKGGDARERKR